MTWGGGGRIISAPLARAVVLRVITLVLPGHTGTPREAGCVKELGSGKTGVVLGALPSAVGFDLREGKQRSLLRCLQGWGGPAWLDTAMQGGLTAVWGPKAEILSPQ